LTRRYGGECEPAARIAQRRRRFEFRNQILAGGQEAHRNVCRKARRRGNRAADAHRANRMHLEIDVRTLLA
jgi:hypothetical protein